MSSNISHQRCALAAPRGPRCLTFATGLLENLSFFFHRNYMLGTLDFTGSEHSGPFSFSHSTALIISKLPSTKCSGIPPSPPGPIAAKILVPSGGLSRVYHNVKFWHSLANSSNSGLTRMSFSV